MPSARFTTACGALVLALVGCSGTVTPAPPSASMASIAAPAERRPSTSAPATFTSAVYGYSLLVPDTWTVQPATAIWDGGEVDHTAAYADRFTDPDGNVYFLLATPTEADLSTFADEHLAWLTSDRGCPPPAQRRSMVVAGSPAVRVSIHCPDGVFGPTLVSKVITAHDGNAAILTAFSPFTGSDAMPTLDSLASSWRWAQS